MATNATSKIDAATEKAYAEAAAKQAEKKADVNTKAVKKAVEADAPKPEAKVETVKKAVKAPAKKKAVKKAAPKKAVAKKAAPKKAAAKKAPAKKPAAKKTTAKKPAPKKVAAAAKTSDNPVIKLKDTIMAKANTKDFTATAKEMAAEVQTRLKTAYAKTGELASEVTEFNKGNVEALVESGKIFFAGMQELGRDQVETTKTVIETVTEDVKKIAAVKSPTELMQLQGELARRNFDAAMSYGSKRSEEIVKLYNDAFAPISSRVSVAAERIKQAA